MAPSIFSRPIAHRGYHDRTRGIIENSPAAFEAAIARGFGIECDLQLTADQIPVVFHDYDLARLTGREGAVRGLSAAEIGALPLLDSTDRQSPQTFSALLGQVAGRVPLVVELKTQADAAANRALAQEAVACAAGYRGPLAFKSFSPDLLRDVRARGYAGPLGIVTYHYGESDGAPHLPDGQRFIRRHLLHYPRSRFTFISCGEDSLDLPAIRFFRSLGFKVISWTIRDKERMPEMRARADQIVFEGFDPDS